MRKKSCLLILAILLVSFGNYAQLSWSRVKIYGSHQQLQQVALIGIPVDHGEYKFDTWFMTDLSNEDIALLDQNGFVYEIVIQDVKAYYVERNQSAHEEVLRTSCPGSTATTFNPETPANFNLGTMGGYFKYQEFLDELDDMVAQYPNLISAKAPISTFTTIDGNPIYWLRISDNPNTDEAESEVLYSAIHHAREPASLSQLIFYMWYLLENYGSNEEVTYLVDNTEMYFVPMLNPDGYRYNELTDPNGGGMHRKNRRNVGTSNKGVDPNRNYGYNWNTTGTSPNPNNDVYAGTGPFSEVETQAMKWFVEQREFQFAFNAHTYGDDLLFPIGWSETEFAAHHNYFERFTSHMVKYNGYANFKSSGLYPASGDSDDWMYTDEIGTSHDTIFAMTPEISNETGDFWPPSTSIINICKNMVHMNLVLAHMPLVFGVTTDLDPSKVANGTGYFHYQLERLGRMNGDITVSVTPISGIQSLGAGNVHTLNLMEIIEDSIQYTLNSGLSFGDDIIFVLETDNGQWIKRDTIYKTYGAGVEIFSDNGSNTTNFSGGWSYTNEDFVSPSGCITDSPLDNYSNNVTSYMEIDQTFSFANSTYAYATFWAKWEIEDNWDYVEFMISTNGGSSWSPLCGKYTNQGGINQDYDEPLYDGFQSDWVFEEIDLSGYLGQNNIRFRFKLKSDQGVTEDGYYFDDFSISTDGTEGIDDFTAGNLQIYPNPASNELMITVDKHIHLDKVIIKNDLGEIVRIITFNGNQTSIDLNELTQGIYFVTAYSAEAGSVTEKFVILRP